LSPTAARRAGPPPVRGRTGEVALLWAHSGAALTWFACVALLAVLARPGARRLLSAPALHRLEEQLGSLLKATAAATAVTLGSGIYLWLKQTAYQAPFSASAAHGVFTLPYAKPYFLALWTKVGLYGLMAVATIPIVRAARLGLRLSDGPGTRVAPASAAAVRFASLVVAVGAVGTWVCVTLLKYFHELVEAARLR
jgi:hypothetical protein